MCRTASLGAKPSLSLSSAETRAQRMQKRADDAALAAAQAHTRCEEKKKQLQQLVLEIDAQQSSAVQEAFNSPSEVAKRIDSVQMKSCSSPIDRFAHQLELIQGTRQVVDKLEKRIEKLRGHCGRCGECITRCSCNCIDCWEVRAQKKQEVAVTLSRAAEAARQHCSSSRPHSVGAVQPPKDTTKARCARHHQSLQEAANLHQILTDSSVAAHSRPTTSPARLMRRAMAQPGHSRATSLPHKAGVSSNRRRFASNEDF